MLNPIVLRILQRRYDAGEIVLADIKDKEYRDAIITDQDNYATQTNPQQ